MALLEEKVKEMEQQVAPFKVIRTDEKYIDFEQQPRGGTGDVRAARQSRGREC